MDNLNYNKIVLDEEYSLPRFMRIRANRCSKCDNIYLSYEKHKKYICEKCV